MQKECSKKLFAFTASIRQIGSVLSLAKLFFKNDPAGSCEFDLVFTEIFWSGYHSGTNHNR